MLNLRWYFVSILAVLTHYVIIIKDSDHDADTIVSQEKLGWDKKYPTLNLVNDLLFVFAFFLARIVFGTINVSPFRTPFDGVPFMQER